MQKVRKFMGWSIVFFIVMLLGYAVSYPSLISSKVELGMSKVDVIAILSGKSYEQSDNLDWLCGTNSWNGCKNALALKASSYISVGVGIDTLFVIGFNKKSKVIFKINGDT